MSTEKIVHIIEAGVFGFLWFGGTTCALHAVLEHGATGGGVGWSLVSVLGFSGAYATAFNAVMARKEQQ